MSDELKRTHDEVPLEEEPDAKRARITDDFVDVQEPAPVLIVTPSELYAWNIHGILGVPHQTVVPRLFATRPGVLIAKPASDGPGRVLVSTDGLLRVGGQTYRAAQLVYECIAEVILSETEARALVHLDGDPVNCAFDNLALDAARLIEGIPAFSEPAKDAPYLLASHGALVGSHLRFPGLAATSMGLLVRRRGLTGKWRILTDKTPTGPQYTVVLPDLVVLPVPLDTTDPISTLDASPAELASVPKRAVAAKASHRADKLIYEAVHGVAVPQGSYVAHVNGILRDTRPNNLFLKDTLSNIETTA